MPGKTGMPAEFCLVDEEQPPLKGNRQTALGCPSCPCGEHQAQVSLETTLLQQNNTQTYPAQAASFKQYQT
jgi:hypothetical protein